MESNYLIENNTQKKKKIMALVLISSALFFDYLCLYELKDKLLSLLVNKYDLTKSYAQRNKSELYSFFLIMAGIGGLLSDLLLNRILLVILCYICSFFGIIGLILLEFNSNNVPDVPVLCKFKDDTYPPNCVVFLYLINILIGCGTGFVRVMLFVIGTDQVRSYGARSVSICIFSMYAVSQSASIVIGIQSIVEYTHKPLDTFTFFLIGIIGCLILSFALFIMGRLLAELRIQKDFIRDYFEAGKELYRSLRRGETIKNIFNLTKIRLHLENRDLDDSLDAVKRLLYISLTWWILVPCCSILGQIDINDVQPSLYLQPSHKFLFNHNLLNCCIVVLAIIIFIYLSLKYLKNDEVFSYKWRFTIGTLLAICACTYSGLLESYRLNAFWNMNDTVAWRIGANQTTLVANVSVLTLIPSYILSAISEVLLFVTGLEYAYLSMPPSLQCSAMGFVWASWGMGSIIASSFYFGLSGKYYDKFNTNQLADQEGHLDYFFYILTAVCLLLFGLMMLILMKFLPSIFNPCFIGLEERLLGADVDEPEEDEDDEKYEYYY